MKFGTWLEQQTSRTVIYLDLDETLLHHKPDGDILPRPHVYEFIKQVRALAPVYILSHGQTAYQQRAADACNFNLRVIGFDNYSMVAPSDNAILVDDRPPDDTRTQSKMEALQIGPERVVPVLPWKGEDQMDRGLLLALPKIEGLLTRREWVEKTPQCLPTKQPFKTYAKARDLAKDLEDKFKKGLKEAAEGHKVIATIKTKHAFRSKTVKRGKAPNKVFDVLRGAILVDNKKQIDGVVESIKKTFRVKKVEHMEPEPPWGYYGAVHVDVMVEDMICEIQVMTKKLWNIKEDLEVKYYRKYRDLDTIPKDVAEKCKAAFKKANGD